VVVHGLVYLIGGASGPGSEPVARVDVYDPVTDSWTTEADPMPEPRWSLAAAAVGSRIVVAAGQSPFLGQYSSRTDDFDVDTHAWTSREPLPATVTGLTMVAVNGLVYAIGGIYDPGVTQFAGTYVFDPAANHWADGPEPIRRRVFAASAVVDDGIYAIGGMVASDFPSWPDTTNTVERLAVAVPDTTPPVISEVRADPSVLWRPNHKLLPVHVGVVASDDSGQPPSCAISRVTVQDEGRVDPSDWQIVGPFSVLLRAERAGGGSGRTYFVIVRCEDAVGNGAESLAQVVVPHSRGK
jgi:hypothetical protein